MFIDKILGPIFQPFRTAWSKVLGVKSMKDGALGDVQRVKRLPNQIKGQVGYVAGAVKGDVQSAKGMMDKGKGAAGAAGQAQQKAKKKMGLFGKKNVCPNCGQVQEKGWDKCPFCINMGSMMGGGGPGAAPGAPGGAPPGPPGGYGAPPGGYGAPPMAGPAKTMAFMQGTGGGSPMQLLGWIVPLKGPNRGELYTLKTQSVVGKDPACDVVLADPFMSSRHATIRAQNGVFILEDHSTNGTWVNDKKIRTHELVDNDFVKFGNTLVKFKSL